MLIKEFQVAKPRKTINKILKRLAEDHPELNDPENRKAGLRYINAVVEQSGFEKASRYFKVDVGDFVNDFISEWNFYYPFNPHDVGVIEQYKGYRLGGLRAGIREGVINISFYCFIFILSFVIGILRKDNVKITNELIGGLAFFSVLIYGGLYLYFLPTIQAYKNYYPAKDVFYTFLVNLFSSWTLLGWIYLIYMAFFSSKRSRPNQWQVTCPKCKNIYNGAEFECDNCEENAFILKGGSLTCSNCSNSVFSLYCTCGTRMFNDKFIALNNRNTLWLHASLISLSVFVVLWFTFLIN